jgi:hypothetical protein
MFIQQISLGFLPHEPLNEYILGSFKYSDGISESIIFNDAVILPFKQVRIIEYLKLTSSARNSAIYKDILSDILVLHDAVNVVKYEFVAANLSLNDSNSNLLQKIAIIVDVLKLNDVVDNSAIFLSKIASVLALLDYTEGAFYETLSDILTLSDTLSNKLIAYEKLLDEILFIDNLPNQSLLIVLSDSMFLNDSVSVHAIFKNIIKEKINLFGSVNFEGAEFLAYVVNTQTSAVSEFENYNFNSFSYPYAAASDGIYKLDDSDTDDGKIIQASIRTGISDFGTSLKKQVPWAYIGITDNGRVLLKTISTDRGTKKERWYEVKSYTDSVDTTRVRMGKGVKAKYWQFEISNIEGEYFNIESMEILPLILKRRIQ